MPNPARIAPIALALAASLIPLEPALAAEPEPVWNIVPPSAGQLEMYDALNTVAPGQLTEDLSRFYKPAGFAVAPEDVTRVARPRPGVTISWDRFAVPHVQGATREDVAFGAGYAGTTDRMFLQDVLRHAGAARAAEFLGPSDSNVAMDREQLRTAYYSREEAAAQVAALPDRFGAEGTRMVAQVDAFLAGINAAQEASCPLGSPVGPDCPVEYAALGKRPQPWDRADLVYVASLVGGIFGKGGGGEAANARWLQQLQQRFGARRGAAIYTDLRERDDAEAPTTATRAFPYGGGPGIHPGRPGVALPDLDGPTAPGTGGDAGGGVPALDLPFGRLDLTLPSGMSNAVLIGAERTTTGHPIAVMGPQTGYYNPQLLGEIVLEGPGIKARGVSFAGTQLVVQLGRGDDYAWSATSASNDNVDTVVERLCNLDGSPPSVESTAYLVDGSCEPMDRDVHEETVLPNAGDPGAPRLLRFEVLRTRHGIVTSRATVGGAPVAIVTERSTYGHEVDSVIGFARLNDPGYVSGPRSFRRAAGAIDYTFNWFYADSRDIAYFSSGRLPVRAPGTDFDLPRWGDRAYDWQGWLPRKQHVRQTNPRTGFLVSWNNKPAPGWSAADNVWGYGSVYRSLALSDRVVRALRGERKVSRAQLVGLVQDAATVDSRARYTLPLLLAAVGDSPRTAAATRLLRAWLRAGAHRVDRDRDGSYGHQAAIALFDQWWEEAARTTLRGRLGDLVTSLPAKLDNHPRSGQGSAWNEIAWYGYVDKDLRRVLGRPVTDPYSLAYCGGGVLSRCRAQLRDSLVAAAERAGPTYDKHQDDIRHVSVGVETVRAIDWQNRPTFQQVVSFTR